jgi:Flp pilus assembly protein TadG
MITNSQIHSGRKLQFARDERGSITIMNLFFVMVLAIFAGIAIDMSNLIQARTKLQVAADTAAHAALYTRDTSDATTAKTTAISLAQDIMPTTRYGDVLRVENISFGNWDRNTQTFTHNTTSRNAVLVVTDRLSANANPVTSFLMQFVGFDNWDVVTPAVFETYKPTCLREGLVAENLVDLQSGNDFLNGFCVHSNEHIEFNQNNTFESGTIVSMPEMGDIVLPSSGYTQNEGLENSLREGRQRLRILARLTDIMNGMTDSTSRYYRDFVTSPVPIAIAKSGVGNGRDVLVADLTPGRVHNIACSNANGQINFEAATYRDVVIITNCETQMANGTAFEDSTLIITDTGSDTVKTPNGFRLGLNDSCADGGGAQLLTFGSISGASGLQMFGSQIIALGDVEFSAQANGIEGASIIAGGTISITSGSSFAFCGSGMGNAFEAEYFRLAT